MNSIVLKAYVLGEAAPVILENCISLSCQKEYYTPYSALKAVFSIKQPVGEIIDVELDINGTKIHKGIVDCAEFKELPFKAVTITSRSHTSMLGQNELMPGLISNVSLNSLMADYIQIPNVLHEDSPLAVNYIYVKEHSSFWEAITNLCLKQYGTYPYIANVNTVRYTPPVSPKEIILTKNGTNVISCGNSFDYTKMISNYHMKDTLGTYNSFNLSESEVTDRGIVRHKHIAFEKQWLDNPVNGLGFKINFGMRAFKSSFVSYLGYNGEDLNDKVSLDGEGFRRISKIEISGGSKGLITKLTCYYDRYNNV